MCRLLGWFATILVLVVSAVTPGLAHATTGADTRCEVDSGRDFPRATPTQAGFDPDRLAAALAFATSRNRVNVQIFRHNCLIGTGPHNGRTGRIPWNVWSVTKSVVSLIAGIAWDRGKLDLGAPIGRYLPPGLGDAEHRSITVADLLTESSGLHIGAINEGVTGVFSIDPDSAVQALGVHFDHPPGTHFSYSQRNVDLLSYVIELAIGEPLQQFAQRALFGPLGIERGDYYWARDRAGHTYGYAHLLIPPDDLVKLGLLLSNNGRWGETQIVSPEYLHRATHPTATNPCYGLLFWVGPGCAEIPSFMPPDTYQMSGVGLQDVFVVPSMDLTIAWTGVFGDHSTEGPAGMLQNMPELSHEFFRKLMAAFERPPFPDPGPWVEPPLGLNPKNYLDSNFTLALFGIGPDAYPSCNVVSCLDIPLKLPFTDAPPGCWILLCRGPDPRTPGIG
ncbi:CubicO group peptidase (beta-lactamase class C family) [Nocardia sp. GAS34]